MREMIHRYRAIIIGLAAIVCVLSRAAENPVIWHTEFDTPDKTTVKWSLPRGATIVPSDDNNAGSCLYVPRPQKRGFATLIVPVTPGHIYRGRARIKCRNVTGTKGAVLYLQFADSNRKHVNGGSFPSGITGTQEWQDVEVHHTIPIPENVAYIRVTAGVDGTGEAWFDDIQLEDITDCEFIQPVAPANGITVQSCLPELKWKLSDKPLKKLLNSQYSANIELGRNPDFSGETIHVSADVAAGCHRMARALERGMWYWRINLNRSGVAFPPSQAASFSVADDAIVWPCQLVQSWQWTDVPRPVLSVDIVPADATIDKVSARINGTPAEIISRSDGRIMFRPAANLPVGIHDVDVSITPATESAEFLPISLRSIFCNKQPASRVSFRSDGIMIVDGKPVFPIGAYRDPSDREDVFDGLLEARFDVTHSYRMDGKAISEPEARTRYLKSAAENDIGVFLGMPRDMVRDRKTYELARYVAETMDTPGLLAWYQFDEPEIQSCTPEDLMATYRAIQAVDPFHPKITLVCSIKFPVADIFRRYAAGCDVFWEDPYPIGRSSLLMVEEKILASREAAGPDKPVWCVLQGHSTDAWNAWKQLKLKSKGKRSSKTIAAMKASGELPVTEPSYEQTRCMAHLAIAAGSKGLIWYWSPNCAVHVKEDSPEVWEGIKKTVSELRELMPWLVAEPTSQDTLTVPAPVRCWSRSIDNKRVIILINPEDEEREVAVGEMAEPIQKMLGNGTESKLRFAPHEVRILKQ